MINFNETNCELDFELEIKVIDFGMADLMGVVIEL
jgi:hypothetical protein